MIPRPVSSTLTALPILLSLAGCGGGGATSLPTMPQGDASPRPGPSAPGADPVTEPEAAVMAVAVPAGSLPEPLPALATDARRVADPPEVLAVATLADAGLRVGYTADGQEERVDARDIGAQWQHMQSCLGVVASPPLVLVVEGRVRPLTVTDDALRDIDGRVNASATTLEGMAVVQVREADFDGSLGDPGFNLRSIMGRWLWLSAGLAERDYPYLCARSAVAEAAGS